MCVNYYNNLQKLLLKILNNYKNYMHLIQVLLYIIIYKKNKVYKKLLNLIDYNKVVQLHQCKN